MFNTLKYTKNLVGAGVPRNQAEKHIEVVSEILEGDVVTKEDFQDLRSEFSELKGEFNGLGCEFNKLRCEFRNLRSEFNELKVVTKSSIEKHRLENQKEFSDLRSNIDALESRLIIKLSTINAAVMAVIATIISLLPK